MSEPEKPRTRLGQYFEDNAINKAEVGRKTGLSNSRLSTLSNDPTSRVRADELYRIALALKADAGELLQYVCGHITLPPQPKPTH